MFNRQKGGKFRAVYSAGVVSAAVLVLLQTFVIPQKLSAVGSTAQAKTVQSASSVSVSSSGSSSASSETSVMSSSSASSSSEKTAVVTDTSYDDGNLSVKISTERVDDTSVIIADVTVSDISYLKTAFAEGTYGRNIKETTSAMAEENSAVLAVNGDYYGFRNSGYVLRNGKLYRDTSSGSEDLAILSDGSFYFFNENSETAEQVQQKGALQIFSFGPALVKNGEIAVDENDEVARAKTSNPRTAIGMISPLHYVIVVSDGRTSESSGLSLSQLAGVLKDAGCTAAYNLDGGGSSTLWFCGKVLNNPTGGNAGNGSSERKVSDIVYFG